MIKKFLKRAIFPLALVGIPLTAGLTAGTAVASFGTQACPINQVPPHSSEVACLWLAPGDLSDFENFRGTIGGTYSFRLRNLNTNHYYGPWSGSGTGWIFSANNYRGVNLGSGRWQWLVTNTSNNYQSYEATWSEN